MKITLLQFLCANVWSSQKHTLFCQAFNMVHQALIYISLWNWYWNIKSLYGFSSISHELIGSKGYLQDPVQLFIPGSAFLLFRLFPIQMTESAGSGIELDFASHNDWDLLRISSSWDTTNGLWEHSVDLQGSINSCSSISQWFITVINKHRSKLALLVL